MAYIRYDCKLPSGKQGWYIYYDVARTMFIDGAGGGHTLEDVKFIRDILNRCVLDMEEREGIIPINKCEQCDSEIDRGPDTVILSGYTFETEESNNKHFCDMGCYQSWSDWDIHARHEINESAYCGSGGK